MVLAPCVCDLGFHGSGLLNGAGALRGPERSTLQSALKRQGGEKSHRDSLPFVSSNASVYRGTVTRTNHVWRRWISGYTHSLQIKTIIPRVDESGCWRVQ